MHLQLGQHGFDVTTRALVVATISASDLTTPVSPAAVSHLIADRPAMITVIEADRGSVTAAVTRAGELFAGAVGVCTGDADMADQAMADGASFVHDPDGLADPGHLRIIEAANVGLLISAPPTIGDQYSFLIERARWAEAAGIARNRIVLHCASDMVDAVRQLGCTAMIKPPDDASAQGASALAVINGARLIASNQVRATRRTIDTVSELLERREPASVT